MLAKIISGGQTGADQAALDVAIKLNIPHGGWIPKGRKTEDGILPEQYPSIPPERISSNAIASPPFSGYCDKFSFLVYRVNGYDNPVFFDYLFVAVFMLCPCLYDFPGDSLDQERILIIVVKHDPVHHSAC